MGWEARPRRWARGLLAAGLIVQGALTLATADPGALDPQSDRDPTIGGVCGDGTLDAGEACDDGAANGTPGSCCASDCTVRSDGSACASGDACRTDETCLAGACRGAPVACPPCTACEPARGCVFTPRTDCALATGRVRAAFDLRRGARPRGHRITFRWKAEGGFAADALADPTARSAYALCVWDRAAGTPRLRFAAGVSGEGACGRRACWRRKGDRFVHRNATAAPDGVTTIEADASLGTIRLLGKGAALALPVLPLATPATVEVRVEGGSCWQLDADAATVRWNGARRFRATLP